MEPDQPTPFQRAVKARNLVHLAQAKMRVASRRTGLNIVDSALVLDRLDEAAHELDSIHRDPQAPPPGEAETFFQGATLEQAVAVVLIASGTPLDELDSLVDATVGGMVGSFSDADLQLLAREQPPVPAGTPAVSQAGLPKPKLRRWF